MKVYIVRIVKLMIIFTIALIYIYIYRKYHHHHRGGIKKYGKERNKISFIFSKIHYVSKEEVLKCDIYNKKGTNRSSEIVIYKMKGDSIVANSREVKLYPPEDEHERFFVYGEQCMKSSYKEFFPKYMLKVDKIDYKKLQTGNYNKRELKYPHKVKNIK